MRFNDFVEAVDNIDALTDTSRLRALRAIYEKVREQAVHDLAELLEVQKRSEREIEAHKIRAEDTPS